MQMRIRHPAVEPRAGGEYHLQRDEGHLRSLLQAASYLNMSH